MIVVANEREIGELSGRMASVERTTDRLEKKLDANSDATAEILRRIAGLDGGWRVLLGISAIMSAIIGIALKFLPTLFHV